MTKKEFVKKLGKKCGISAGKAESNLDGLENALLELIATNDSVKFIFGTIGGKTLPKHEVGKSGDMSVRIIKPPRGGFPYFKASPKAKEY